jgi:hypothetical protein
VTLLPVAKYKKTGTLNGYATIKAVARAAPSRSKAKPAKPAKPPEPAAAAGGRGTVERAEVKSLGAHVARTAIPTKQLIHCHACGYSFQLHGRTKEINCSKCRIILDLRDHVIDGPSTETIKTAGAIHIKPTGIVQEGELVAQDIVLEGTVEPHRVEIFGRKNGLVLHGAKL